MQMYKTIGIGMGLVLLISIKIFGDEVATGRFNEDLNSTCFLKSNIYYVNANNSDIILPLNVAKSQEGCEKKKDYAQIEEAYNKLSKTRCDFYSASKNYGCKKMLGYIEINFKNYSDILSACDYFLKTDNFTHEALANDVVVQGNPKHCKPGHFKEKRKLFQINEPVLQCSKDLPTREQCITKSNRILTRIKDFGNGWKINNVIWSNSLGEVSTQEEAIKKCSAIGGRLPTLNDFQLFAPPREVIEIRNGWLDSRSADDPQNFDKYPEKRMKMTKTQVLRFLDGKKTKKVAVKKDKYNVYCIKEEG